MVLDGGLFFGASPAHGTPTIGYVKDSKITILMGETPVIDECDREFIKAANNGWKSMVDSLTAEITVNVMFKLTFESNGYIYSFSTDSSNYDFKIQGFIPNNEKVTVDDIFNKDKYVDKFISKNVDPKTMEVIKKYFKSFETANSAPRERVIIQDNT